MRNNNLAKDCLEIPLIPPAGIGFDLDEIDAVDRHRVLVVEDDLDTIFLLKQILRIAGFNVVSASNGNEALKKVVDYQPDIALLDLMMPEMDGWQTLAYLRKMTELPVIVVSALGTKENVVTGLKKGVDDYISKPFNNRELVERVKAVLRRTQPPQEISRLVFPQIDLIVDLMTQEVILEGNRIWLTPKEFAVLSILAKHAPAIVSYETISDFTWAEDSPHIRKRTKYLIYLLRQKFQNVLPDSNLILNVDRIGYKLLTED